VIRRTPASTQASAAFLTALFALGLASAQEGNPLDRPRPRPETGGGPAWAGIFLDDSEETVFVLVPGEGEKFEGVLAEQSAGPAGEYMLEGVAREGKLEGSLEKDGQRYLFVAKMDDDTLVVTSGSTTSRWRRAPGAPRDADALRALLARVRRGREQNRDAPVIGALRTLSTAQAIFREGDKEADELLDYGTLEELARANLVDPELGSGTKFGYRFEVRPSRSTPEFLWMATASPIEPRPDARHYVTNHAGVVFYSTTAPFTWNDACSIPDDATPVGAGEDEHGEDDGHGHGSEPQFGPTPDLSHVKVGQRYTYTMKNEGAPPMQMVYTVRKVEGGTVHYEITTIMDLGQGPQPVGPPTPQEWSHQGGDPGGDPEGSVREQVTISGVTFDCLVIVSGESKVWVPMSGSVPTFPGLVKTTTGAASTMELTKVE
jgi:hypothetical protein